MHHRLYHPIFILTAALSTVLVGATVSDLTDHEIAARRRMAGDNGHLHKIERVPPDTEVTDLGLAEAQKDLFMLQFSEFEQTVDDESLIKECTVSPFRLQCLPDSCATNDKGRCVDCKMRFCAMNWDGQQSSPEKYPSFMYLTDTEHCTSGHITMDLYDAYDMVKAADEEAASQNSDFPSSRSLPLSLGIFDMGQTSPERTTNIFLTVGPEYKVLANSQPLNEALEFCDSPMRKNIMSGCNRDYAIDLFKKVSYLMCRSCDEFHEECIVRFFSEASKSIDVFHEALEGDSDWAFLFNDAETFMGAAIDPEAPDRAPCARLKRNPTEEIEEVAKSEGREVADFTVEEVCAANTRSLVNAALKAYSDTGTGHFFDTEKIPEVLYNYLENVKGKTITEKRIEKIRNVINKDRKGHYDENGFVNKQSQHKNRASIRAKSAASRYLEGPITTMRAFNNQV